MRIDTSKIDGVLAKLKKKEMANQRFVIYENSLREFTYPVLFRRIQKKIKQIASISPTEIEHFKNLRYDSSDYRRVQVGSFVLFFRLEGDRIIFERFRHHDSAYRR